MKGDEDDYVPARKVVISPKRLNELDLLGRAVYEPVYDERELKEDNEEDKKELEARRLKAKRAERKYQENLLLILQTLLNSEELLIRL